ncbi:hypothetical protein PoB_006101100 [Plakobranchus ocellatus]|uniref:Uncharacterized protein n=1 Tax=Plakobranchus ocellatus TaxID=259542 RepID=A0AAV4CRM9_9GAST|nr:hypothetical protein PoB_006101100 [Plakobranchus ocellatus]
MSTALKLCILVLALTLATARPHERQKRQAFRQWWSATRTYIRDVADDLKDGITDVYTWATAATVDEEAEVLLVTGNQTATFGEQLQFQGRRLYSQAQRLRRLIATEINDPENLEKLQDAIDALTEAARDAVKTGQTVLRNSENITRALGDSFDDLSTVVQDSLADVGESVLDIGDSVVDAGKALVLVGASARNTSQEIIEAMQQVMETSDLVVQAGHAIQVVGGHTLSLGQRVLQMGRDVGEVLRQAGRNIYQAAGLGTQDPSS